MVRISLCMIVRDEEANLDRCLYSVHGIVDEICVVDTGSTDRTVEIAKAHGARVEFFDWCDDFGAARNAALGMATGDWILVLDADEYLRDSGTRDQLEAFAYAYPVRAGQATIVDEHTEGEVRSKVSRFFPNRPELHYRGRLHEQPYLGDDFISPATLPVEIGHSGYLPEAIAARDKIARNLKLLEQQVQDNPTDPYPWFQLGRTHYVGKNHEAALDAFTRALDHVEPEAPYLALLLELTGYAMRNLGRSLEALALLQQVSAAFIDRPDTCYLEALLALDVGHLELAEARFQHCLGLTEVEGQGGSSSEMTRSWGPAYHLGLLREMLEMPDDAREFYDLALSFRGDHPEALAGIERLNSGQTVSLRESNQVRAL